MATTSGVSSLVPSCATLLLSFNLGILSVPRMPVSIVTFVYDRLTQLADETPTSTFGISSKTILGELNIFRRRKYCLEVACRLRLLRYLNRDWEIRIRLVELSIGEFLIFVLHS